MKKVFSIAVLSLVFATSNMASIIPTESLLLIKTTEIEVALEDSNQKNIFKLAQFSKDTNSLDFVTEKEIKYVQIFTTDGKLEYQLPVSSNKVRISKKLFERGDYRIGFILDGMKTIEFTGVKVK